MAWVLALSAWLGLETLQSGPSIAGRVLDAQTGDPVAGAAIVIDGRTAGAAGADGLFSVPAGSTHRADVLVTAVGYAFVTRRVDVTASGAARAVYAHARGDRHLCRRRPPILDVPRRLAPPLVEGAKRLDATSLRVDALRVDARLQLVGGCGLEGDVGAESGTLLSVFQRHRTNSVVLPIRRRQVEALHAGK